MTFKKNELINGDWQFFNNFSFKTFQLCIYIYSSYVYTYSTFLVIEVTEQSL